MKDTDAIYQHITEALSLSREVSFFLFFFKFFFKSNISNFKAGKVR